MSNVHDEKDKRNISIKNVGICNYYAPFIFVNDGEEYITTSKIKAGVSVPADSKGAHLSRINMVINEKIVNKKLSIDDIKGVTKILAKEVGVDNANLELNFIIGLNYKTPKSDSNTNLTSNITIYIRVNNNKIENESITVTANAAMLCPNSKAKSRYGAHSQKCNIKTKLYDNISKVNVRNIYTILCNSDSAPVYDIVRSTDEVYLTELAYDNPKFSEDAIRDLLINIRKEYKKGKIEAELENLESIHQHNVYCIGEK